MPLQSIGLCTTPFLQRGFFVLGFHISILWCVDSGLTRSCEYVHRGTFEKGHAGAEYSDAVEIEHGHGPVQWARSHCRERSVSCLTSATYARFPREGVHDDSLVVSTRNVYQEQLYKTRAVRCIFFECVAAPGVFDPRAAPIQRRRRRHRAWFPRVARSFP